MKLNLILAYENLENYITKGCGEEAWHETMVLPYWNILTEGAPFPMDFKKPVCNLSKEQAEKQLQLFRQMDWSKYLQEFQVICEKLPKDDEDPLQIAIYPSLTDMDEGIYGTGVWGNILLNINPMNHKAVDWIPYVFAHEYHHSVWGDYWYCKRGGEGITETFLQNLVIEGEADAFAKSLYKDKIPSWHKGVSSEEEEAVWAILEEKLQERLSPEECGKYMFGSKELQIPANAGYFYGIKIVENYLQKNREVNLEELLKILPDVIFDASK